MRHFLTHLLDEASRFVSRNNRLTDPNRAKATILKIMKIRTANAPGSHSHKHLTWAWRWTVLRLDAKILLAMKADNPRQHVQPFLYIEGASRGTCRAKTSSTGSGPFRSAAKA
jgi:hypothetical protein